MIGEKANCLLCKRDFQRRTKGMKDRAYKKPLRPYRCLTCSSKCSVLYTRMPLNKRNLLKAQGGIINMEEFIPEVILSDDLEIAYFDDEKEQFGFILRSEEKHNTKAPKGSEEEYYHDVIAHKFFKDRQNLESFKQGMKLMGNAIFEEIELEENN